MRYNNLTVQEWKDIAGQAKKAREELFKLMRLTSGKVPVNVIDPLPRSIYQLDTFRSKAENQMFFTGVSDDVNIFYGQKE